MATQQQRRSATRAAVLTAAIEAFSDSAVATVSLEEIAGRTGATKGTLLYHYGSRSGILEAVATELIVRFEDQLAAQTDDLGLADWLRAVLTLQTTPIGRVLYDIDDELAAGGQPRAALPMDYLTRRLGGLGVRERAEPVAAAVVQYGRMLARGQRSAAEIDDIVRGLEKVAISDAAT